MANIRKVVSNKYFLGGLLITAFIYSTVLCFFRNPLVPDNTISMIGVEFPPLFLIWILLNGCAFFFCHITMEKTYQWNTKLGRSLKWGALIAMPVFYFVNATMVDGVPVYLGVSKPIHWAAAIIFIGCNAAAMGFLFIYARKQMPRFNIFIWVIIAMVVCMLAVIIFIGKSALFEAIPSWLSYIMLFLTNCTNLFAPPAAQEQKVPA